MDTIQQIFRAGSNLPKHYPGDEVYPVHYFDQLPHYKTLVVAWTLRVNDVLDPDQLHNALARLLDIGDWRKLGGRLRRRDDGRLEIHVPTLFTAERPAITFTQEIFPIPISEHPLGSKFPNAQNEPKAFIHPSAGEFSPFAFPTGTPRDINPYLSSDRPQLGLHIVSFSDVTLVSLYWPHTLMDGMARRALLQNWCLVLAGREDDIIPLEGAREDILYEVATDPKNPLDLSNEKLNVGKYILNGLSVARFFIQRILDMIFAESPYWKIIYLPKSALNHLREEAQIRHGTLPYNDSEILTSWIGKIVSQGEATPRPVTILSALDMRLRLPSVFCHPQKAYMQNTAVGTHSPLTLADLQAPLSQTTEAYHNSIKEQSDPDYIRGSLSILAQGKKLPVYSVPNAAILFLTNARLAKFIEVDDFGPALVKKGHGCPSAGHGRMVYQHLQMVGRNGFGKVASLFAISGEDHEGGFWTMAALRPKAWGLLEKELERLAERKTR